MACGNRVHVNLCSLYFNHFPIMISVTTVKFINNSSYIKQIEFSETQNMWAAETVTQLLLKLHRGLLLQARRLWQQNFGSAARFIVSQLIVFVLQTATLLFCVIKKGNWLQAFWFLFQIAMTNHVWAGFGCVRASSPTHYITSQQIFSCRARRNIFFFFNCASNYLIVLFWQMNTKQRQRALGQRFNSSSQKVKVDMFGFFVTLSAEQRQTSNAKGSRGWHKLVVCVWVPKSCTWRGRKARKLES